MGKYTADGNRKKLYDIEPEETFLLLREQSNKCAICGILFENSRFLIDHCHKTGNVRGLLCNHCNFLLGFANDDVYILNNAIKYLKQSPTAQKNWLGWINRNRKSRKNRNTIRRKERQADTEALIYGGF